ncbi:Inner membrane ABC transporter permease protein ycjP [uncultured Ruminococcus sp.]|uniref:Carbohydrate ABC transporter permease n=1 Tax=Massiliimalia timonensis TaxID=1987501 RepID=A0A8J6PC26_9FIRM|nr:carbohydrate ABC transporter permease [Massiliimalia timonensis]MBC8609646.1 carbohydrate ABC transporter permease [Massiliimalia timonensis]SCH33088.1 Inner membrane ABC transporter permease protein ycjP [uncultured Ruminococcus sp.]SCH36092.1 Inner membrane ABC transporter permease protein ycjP [uncultured Clostridium sp.]
MSNKIKPERAKFQGFHIIYYLILTISAVAIILPFFWLVMTSFDKFNTYSLPFPPRLLPENPSVFNYDMALKNVPIISYLVNTFIIVILSVVLNIFVATLSGFCISKGKFPGRNLILLFILSNMMVPFEIKLMPIYNIIKGVGLSNNYLGVVLPGVMTNAMFIFFIKQFCDGLPSDLYEAGVIDGASKIRIYAQIFLPLMGPVVATLVVLDVVNVWNDLLWPMIVLTDANLSTIQLGLVRYNTGANGQVHAGIQTALSVLSVLPLGIIFCFMQKYIVQSIAASGLKQ